MNIEIKTALIEKLTALADDELILAQRNGEWVGHAPILEEDIALANITQDELGHAMLYLDMIHVLDVDNPKSEPDKMAFFREVNDFRNCNLVEFPKGDWAFTMLRQYFFDFYEALWLSKAQESSYTPLAEAAAKMLREERFHLQHTHAWVERLGLGTEESTSRMQAALDELWDYAQQLFIPLENEAILVQENIVPDLEALRLIWTEQVTKHLEFSGLSIPEKISFVPKSRSQHTEHLWSLISEMQSTARFDSEASVW